MNTWTRIIPQPYPDDLRRCCRDSLRKNGPDHPTEGLELPCDWCPDILRFTEGCWVLIPAEFPRFQTP